MTAVVLAALTSQQIVWLISIAVLTVKVGVLARWAFKLYCLEFPKIAAMAILAIFGLVWLITGFVLAYAGTTLPVGWGVPGVTVNVAANGVMLHWLVTHVANPILDRKNGVKDFVQRMEDA